MHSSRLLRLILMFALLLAAALLAGACGSDSKDDSSGSDTAAEQESSGGGTSGDVECTKPGSVEMPKDVADRNEMYDAPPCGTLDPAKTYTVRVKTTKGNFDIVLDQKAGPIAAANFAFLVKEGYYDGILFHRVIKGFMVQTGDPTGTGSGGPGYAIEDDEVSDPYPPGTVAMANAGPNTGGSQFFIVQGTDVGLTPDYAIFGHVPKAGLKVIDAIASVKVGPGGDGALSAPVKPVRLLSLTLEER